MASITDCVVEGLKYSFRDVKKLLIFGVLFAVLNFLNISRANTGFDIARKATEIRADNITSLISQIPPADMAAVLVLSIISFIVLLAVMGYKYDLIKFSIDKKETMPEFSDIKKLFKNGLSYFIVCVVYFAIPVLLLIAGIYLSIYYSHGLYMIIISAVMFIIAYFLFIMALNNMIAYACLKKAFDLKEITSKISNLGQVKYIGTILFTLIVLGIITAVAGFILSILAVAIALLTNQVIIISAIIGIIEGITVSSYTNIVYSRILGSVYRESVK